MRLVRTQMTGRKPRTRERGSTLLELVVGLALLGVAFGGIFSGFKGGLSAWIVAQQFTGEQANARAILTWTTRRLRMAGSMYPGTPITVANASEVVFYYQVPAAGGAPVSWCNRIYRNATDGIVYIARTWATSPTLPADCGVVTGDPISTGAEARRLTVTGLTLNYFDDSASPAGGNQLTSLPLSLTDRVRVRRIEVVIDVTGLQLASPLRMASQVYLRR